MFTNTLDDEKKLFIIIITLLFTTTPLQGFTQIQKGQDVFGFSYSSNETKRKGAEIYNPKIDDNHQTLFRELAYSRFVRDGISIGLISGLGTEGNSEKGKAYLHKSKTVRISLTPNVRRHFKIDKNWVAFLGTGVIIERGKYKHHSTRIGIVTDNSAVRWESKIVYEAGVDYYFRKDLALEFEVSSFSNMMQISKDYTAILNAVLKFWPGVCPEERKDSLNRRIIGL